MGFAGTRALPLGKVKYKVLVVLPFGKRKKKKKNPREKLLPYSKVTENQNILRIEKPRACYTVTTRGIFMKWKVKEDWGWELMCGRLSRKFNLKLGSRWKTRPCPPILSTCLGLVGSQYKSLLTHYQSY